MKATYADTPESLDPVLINLLSESIEGFILLPGETSYNNRRALLNCRPNARPLMIVQPTNAMDVAKTVRFAIENNIELSVRGNKQVDAAYSTCSNALVIDLSLLTWMIMGDFAESVSVGAGVSWDELDSALGGKSGNAGIPAKVGYELVALEIVTADGEIRTASLAQHPDLFWALRQGGNLGVVTALTFKLGDDLEAPTKGNANPWPAVSTAATSIESKEWLKRIKRTYDPGNYFFRNFSNAAH